jgi:hypothetical protein
MPAEFIDNSGKSECVFLGGKNERAGGESHRGSQASSSG